MEKIDLKAILAKHSSNIQTKLNLGYDLSGKETLTLSQATAAMQELWNLAVDKCAANFSINQIVCWGLKTGDTEIDEDSIEKVKQMIL